MEITRTSLLTGTVRTLQIDITPEQLTRYKAGELIQWVLGRLSVGDRLFILERTRLADYKDQYPQ